MIWALLVLLTAAGATAAVGLAVNERRRRALPGAAARALPAPRSDARGDLIERGVRELRVGDIVTHEGKDFLCEGVVDYDEDGHRWVAGRLVDDGVVRWLVVGIERAGGGAVRLLAEDDAAAIAGYPPEALVLGDVRHVLDKRGAATCQLRGELGPLGGLKKGRPDGHVERCRWWLYSAPGDDTVIVEQWGADHRVLRGKKKLAEAAIELMPGS